MIPKGYKPMQDAPRDGRTIVVAFADRKRIVWWWDCEWMRDEAPEVSSAWRETNDNADTHEEYDALHWRDVRALDLMGAPNRTS